MKAKDYIKKLVGKPTSEELRQGKKKAEREARQAEREKLRMQKREAAKDRERAAEIESERVKKAVTSEFEKRATEPGFDPRIPHPALNFNVKPCVSYQEYYDVFCREAVLRQLPALLSLAGYRDIQEDFTMLDYGCGLGRLAFAATSYFGTAAARRYIGYEVHPAALNFLQKAYAGYPNVKMFGAPVSIEDSYVEIHEIAEGRQTAKEPRTSASELGLAEGISHSLDLQFSSSVFTHMYRPGIIHVLKEVAGKMKPEGVCVNTWLIVDQLAETSIRCGLADRVLPFENKEDGFLYYLEDNPLMCSAYRLEAIKAIYAEAGHEIIDILWGHWSGRKPTHDFSRQDVVISRPLKRNA